jgi:hypothetical protein
MVCSNCGSNLEFSGGYCPNCGRPVELSAQVAKAADGWLRSSRRNVKRLLAKLPVAAGLIGVVLSLADLFQTTGFQNPQPANSDWVSASNLSCSIEYFGSSHDSFEYKVQGTGTNLSDTSVNAIVIEIAIYSPDEKTLISDSQGQFIDVPIPPQAHFHIDASEMVDDVRDIPSEYLAKQLPVRLTFEPEWNTGLANWQSNSVLCPAPAPAEILFRGMRKRPVNTYEKIAYTQSKSE